MCATGVRVPQRDGRGYVRGVKKWVRKWVAKGRRAGRRGGVWVRESRLLALSLGLSAAGAIAAVVVTFVLGDWLTGTGPGEETGSTTIRNLGIAAAGLVALPLAVWRAQVADQQAKASRQQADTTHLALLNELYQRGVSLLQGATLPDRLTGVDALRRLAEEWPGCVPQPGDGPALHVRAEPD